MMRVQGCVLEQDWLPCVQISGEERPGITHPDSHIWRYFLCPVALNSDPANRHHSDLTTEGRSYDNSSYDNNVICAY